jgi:protoporphyrinogen oxidase
MSRWYGTGPGGVNINYSEKLWGLPADQLSPDVATRRLGGMTLRSLLVELVRPHRKARHIDGAFLYPLGGYGELPAALAARLPPGAAHLEHEAAGFDVDRDRIVRVRFAGREAVEVGDRLVATLPLTILVRLLGRVVPEGARRHRSASGACASCSSVSRGNASPRARRSISPPRRSASRA